MMRRSIRGLRGLAARVSRSVKRSVGIRYNRVEALIFDLRHGTDTRGKAPVSELAPIGDNVEHGTGYQAVNERHLRAAVAALPLPGDSVFVDIGCGKGKALLIASTLGPIDRVIGVEFSGELCEIARRNADSFAPKDGKRRAPIAVVHEDALEFDLEADHNLVFLNNPFDHDLTARFTRILEASLKARPRPVWLLYANPRHVSAIEEGGRFRQVRYFRFFGPGRDIAAFHWDGSE